MSMVHEAFCAIVLLLALIMSACLEPMVDAWFDRIVVTLWMAPTVTGYSKVNRSKSRLFFVPATREKRASLFFPSSILF